MNQVTQREVKFEVMLRRYKDTFKTEVLKHYTTLNRLINKKDPLDYDMVDIIAKRQLAGIVNDVEVYEGDIVLSAWIAPDETYPSHGWVGWCHHRLQFVVHDNFGESDSLGEHWCDCTVIGNIYENPELLEEIILKPANSKESL
ncbi:YopX family protein [Paraferrimonas haliotis]|uniref:YopX protein domain-containing protein n=1 Tax=Paraferrimonas haliotis TaxID=2013866 RepID=A0AA37WY08_9GAMM|nr:YopX family protein [Paraferrimonas haliotis]GLS83255.1 hypothetical protein GCM10007894_12320 [Paraferrimonas haliotis]